jgi:hypothetical protein
MYIFKFVEFIIDHFNMCIMNSAHYIVSIYISIQVRYIYIFKFLLFIFRSNINVIVIDFCIIILFCVVA